MLTGAENQVKRRIHREKKTITDESVIWTYTRPLCMATHALTNMVDVSTLYPSTRWMRNQFISRNCVFDCENYFRNEDGKIVKLFLKAENSFRTEWNISISWDKRKFCGKPFYSNCEIFSLCGISFPYLKLKQFFSHDIEAFRLLSMISTADMARISCYKLLLRRFSNWIFNLREIFIKSNSLSVSSSFNFRR